MFGQGLDNNRLFIREPRGYLLAQNLGHGWMNFEEPLADDGRDSLRSLVLYFGTDFETTLEDALYDVLIAAGLPDVVVLRILNETIFGFRGELAAAESGE